MHFTRCGLFSCLVSLIAAQAVVENENEPFDSKIVRKSLENGTIVEYEYLYYYDTEEHADEPDDFEDEPTDVSTLSSVRAQTPTVKPTIFTTPAAPEPTRFSVAETAAPVRFHSGVQESTLRFSNLSPVTDNRVSSPVAHTRFSSFSPAPAPNFPIFSSAAPISFHSTSPAKPTQFVNHSRLRPINFSTSNQDGVSRFSSKEKSENTLADPNTITHHKFSTSRLRESSESSPFSTEHFSTTATSIPTEPSTTRAAEIAHNEVTERVNVNDPTDRSHNRKPNRITNRNIFRPAIVTESPLLLPSLQPHISRKKQNFKKENGVVNVDRTRFFGSRQRGQSVRPVKVDEIKTDFNSANDQPPTATESSDEPPTESTTRHFFRSRNTINSFQSPSQQKRRRPATNNIVATTVTTSQSEITTSPVTESLSRGRGSSRFRSGTTNRLTNSISLNSPIVEHNLFLGPRRTARRRPIESNPTVFNRGNDVPNQRGSRLINQLPRRQQAVPELTTTTRPEARLPQGTRFPPRSTITQSPTTASTVPLSIDEVSLNDVSLNGNNLYSLSRIAEPDFQTEQPLPTTVDLDVKTTTEEDIKSTNTYFTIDPIINEQTTLHPVELSHLRPRPGKIVQLKALPALTTTIATTTESTTDHSAQQTEPSITTERAEIIEDLTTREVTTNDRRYTENEVYDTTTQVTTTIQPETTKPALSIEKTSRQTSAIRQPLRTRSFRRRNNQRTKNEPVSSEENDSSGESKALNDNAPKSEGGLSSSFRRTTHRRRPFVPASRSRNRQATNDRNVENASEETVAEHQGVQTETRRQTSTIHRQAIKRLSGGRRKLSARIGSKKAQSDTDNSDSQSTEANTDSESVTRIEETSTEIQRASTTQKEPKNVRQRPGLRRRPSLSINLNRNRPSRPSRGEKASNEESSDVNEEVEAIDKNTNDEINVDDQEIVELEASNENPEEKEQPGTADDVSKLETSVRPRRPFRGRTQNSPNRRLSAIEITKEEKSVTANKSEQGSFRSRFSGGRSRGRENVRRRGFLPPTKATERPIEQSTTTEVATETITTTENMSEDHEELVSVENEKDEDEDVAETDDVEPNLRHGLKRLTTRRRSSISRNNKEKKMDKLKDHSEKNTEETEFEEDSESVEERKNEDSSSSPVVKGSRSLRFNTARNAPSVRDNRHKFGSIQRSLFGGGDRPSPFRHIAVRHSGGLRSQLSEQTSVLASERRDVTEKSTDDNTETTIVTEAPTTVGQSDVTVAVTQRSFRLPFSGGPRKELDERRRKFVPGGFRRPPTTGFQALRRNQLRTNEESSPGTKAPQRRTATTTEKHEESGDKTEASTVEYLTITEASTTPIVTVPSSTKSVRLATRRRGGRQTQLSLSDQLRILNGQA